MSSPLQQRRKLSSPTTMIRKAVSAVISGISGGAPLTTPQCKPLPLEPRRDSNEIAIIACSSLWESRHKIQNVSVVSKTNVYIPVPWEKDSEREGEREALFLFDSRTLGNARA